MAIQLRPCSIESREFAYPPRGVQEDQRLPDLVKRYEAERSAGLELIQGLKGRVRTVEKDLKAERLNHNVTHEQYEAQLFAERQRSTLLEKELAAAREQVQLSSARIQQIEEQLDQSVQIIQANREENAALNRRVVQLTEQLAESIQQVRDLQALGNDLQARMIEKEEYTNQLQRQILQGQQERRREEEELKLIELQPMIVRIYQFIRDGIKGNQ